MSFYCQLVESGSGGCEAVHLAQFNFRARDGAYHCLHHSPGDFGGVGTGLSQSAVRIYTAV